MGDTRAAFEAWAVERLIACHYTTEGGVSHYAPLDASEPAAWDAWQASRKQALEEARFRALIHSQYPIDCDFDRGYSKARQDAANAIRSLEGNAPAIEPEFRAAVLELAREYREGNAPICECEACAPNGNPFAGGRYRMILCATCGNKRCPHATDHRNACAGSNEPGQKGSSWENYTPSGNAKETT